MSLSLIKAAHYSFLSICHFLLIDESFLYLINFIMGFKFQFIPDAPGAPRQWWFGGGTDLTPAYIFEEDVKHFHTVCVTVIYHS